MKYFFKKVGMRLNGPQTHGFRLLARRFHFANKIASKFHCNLLVINTLAILSILTVLPLHAPHFRVRRKLISIIYWGLIKSYSQFQSPKQAH